MRVGGFKGEGKNETVKLKAYNTREKGSDFEVHELVVTGVKLLEMSADFQALEGQEHVLIN